jgi:glycosyltransferase involved in cell wall biosynthesis
MQMKLQVDIPIIGYIGSIFNRDAKLMADAFNLVLKKYPQALLLAAGYFDAHLESMIDRPSSIVRTGPVRFSEIGDILSACDVCWLPMRDSPANQGRWPIKLSDYMAAGRPVVSTNVGDLGEFIERQGIGLVSKDTPEDLSRIVIDLLGDEGKCLQFGLRARKLSETAFSWDTVTLKLDQFYTDIVAGGI